MPVTVTAEEHGGATLYRVSGDSRLYAGTCYDRQALGAHAWQEALYQGMQAYTATGSTFDWIQVQPGLVYLLTPVAEPEAEGAQMPQLTTVDDYRTALAGAVAARPERAWTLARMALETAARLVPQLQPHAALLGPQNAAVVAEYGGQIADASSIPEVKVVARWAGQAVRLALTIHDGLSDAVGGDGQALAELAAGILQQVDTLDELDSWARLLAAATG
jgi:hypothetical protein